ncbi:hypothetical protein HMPREF0175_0400 [Bifidobacterium longum subsp. longum ATCC 55813]|nr:hypothetical protein HMPREF0175_0400 [Bifidobacterium longum subsp. longum ATCC 55813]
MMIGFSMPAVRRPHQGDAMNLYRYAMFIARACRGSFVGNVLFANPRMALFSMLV